MHPLTALSAVWVMPNHTPTEALALLLRWTHFVAGITWVGLLYFFNLVNVPFMKQVDATLKPKVFQYLTLPALQWFRWSALVTVFVGFWYWAQIYVAADARRMGVSAWNNCSFPGRLDSHVGSPVFDHCEDGAERMGSGGDYYRACYCGGMAVREIYARGPGRQS